MTNDKPEPNITVIINGAEQSLLMTFGLLNRLLKKAGAHVEALLVGGAPEVRDDLFAEALNKRGRSGCFDNFTVDMVDELDMDSETAQRLLLWIMSSVVDFYLGVLERAKATEERFTARTQALMPSPNSTPA